MQCPDHVPHRTEVLLLRCVVFPCILWIMFSLVRGHRHQPDVCAVALTATAHHPPCVEYHGICNAVVAYVNN
jgi:hypothetical protein